MVSVSTNSKEETDQAAKRCYQCGKDNPEQAFCGTCGSSLALNDFIATKVKAQIADSIRDRDVLEMDSSIKVFTQAWGWMKLIVGTVVTLLVLTGAGVWWKVSDFWSGADKAKQSVTDTAKKNTDEIVAVSSQSKQDIAKTVETAKSDVTASSNAATVLTQSMKATALQSKNEISRDTKSFRSDLEGSRQQLQAANKLQPEIETIRKQLTQATNDIQAQHKIISSSEDFAKSVFSTHAYEIFDLVQPPRDRYAVIPPVKPGNTVVLLLLQKSPIPGTLQLQQFVAVQPPNSYFPVVHNLIMFFWGDPPAGLLTKPLSVSYFPDADDKDLIHSLSEHDGRWFADDQPLPKFNQPDPDFRGNKWMPGPTNSTKP
jgi:hypothetical protein